MTDSNRRDFLRLAAAAGAVGANTAPGLIQKALADKLSDKIQVIIAPPPAQGGFIGANVLGTTPAAKVARQDAAYTQENE